MSVRTMPAHMTAAKRISWHRCAELAVELVGIIRSDKEHCSEF